MSRRNNEGKRPSVPAHRTYRWGLLLLILLAFGLRLHNAELFSFWTDEGLTPLRASYTVPEILSNHVIIQDGITNDTHPPLFFLIVHFTRQIWGETDFAYRYPALLAGVLLVPLLAALAQRMKDWQLGLVVAALTAVNPLQIWYANEARMYTLAVLLVTAASYILWRAIAEPAAQKLVRQLFLYILLAGLAFYTHYTAAFLIAAQALFWVLILWRQGYRRLLGGTAILALLIAAPLIPYTVPRFFHGYEANFYHVSPWIMLQDVVRFFALGRSVNFESTGIILLNSGAFLLLLVGLWGARGEWKRPFLLVWLLAIVLGLMAGSLIKPMYQGVRHIMLGSPAFLLLLGYGIVTLAQGAYRGKSRLRPVCGIGLALGVAVTAVGSVLALDNYYHGRFGKDDFRRLIEYVEARAGDNDVFLYNNAILLPLHDHYQQRADVAVTASPVYPYRADTSPPQLAALAQTYDRIWLVTDPPADGRDANGVVQQWLDDNLMLIESTYFESQTVEVRVRGYDTGPKELLALPENGRLLNLQWPDYPELVGAALQVAEPVVPPAIWLDLYWQGDAPTQLDGLRFQLQGPDGHLGWQMVETAVNSAQSWQTEAINRRSYALPLPNGTPPGSYTILVQPLLLSDVPQVLGDPQVIGEIAIAPDTNTLADWPRQPAAASFTNGVILRDVTLADTAVRPGNNLPFTLFWEMDNAAPITNLHYELLIVATDGTVLRRQEGIPGANWLSVWLPEQRLREPNGLYFPPETEPGTYRLEMQLWQGDDAVAGRPFWWPFARETVVVSEVEVTPWPLETAVPADTTPIAAQFGSHIQLHSYDLAVDSEHLELTLYWRAESVPENNWFVFVHLVNSAGDIVAQQDFFPAGGLRPTIGWRANEVITDVHQLALPPDLPPGPYFLRVGLFEPDTFVRPSVTMNNQPQPDNQLILTELTLP
ncbi:MAG: glycosyltransferase family 39 protein [Ardenticatenaceae bacterium]|nr:glycosyltransferase family 39 protein [Ardenticatenaceae bacterium]